MLKDTIRYNREWIIKLKIQIENELLNWRSTFVCMPEDMVVNQENEEIKFWPNTLVYLKTFFNYNKGTKK